MGSEFEYLHAKRRLGFKPKRRFVYGPKGLSPLMVNFQVVIERKF
jgi:hypothetical protein